MTITRVGSSNYTPSGTGGVTTRSIVLPTGIQAGDFIIVGFVKAGSANGFTQSAGPTLTDAVDSTLSGFWGSVFTRLADGTESGATVTFTTASAYRSAGVAVVYRGVASANVLDTSTYQQGNVVANIVAPAATATATDFRVDIAAMTTNTAGATISTASGMTVVQSVSDPATSGGGYNNIALYENLTAVSASTAVAANTYTGSVAAANTGFTLLLKELAATSTVYPISTVSNTGAWTAVGGADLPTVLADQSNTTYAQSPASPSSASFEVEIGYLTSGQVQVTYPADIDAGTSGTLVVELKQGSTVISTWTHSDLSTTTKTYTDQTTAAEAANITDYSKLSVFFSGTAS